MYIILSKIRTRPILCDYVIRIMKELDIKRAYSKAQGRADDDDRDISVSYSME